MSTRQSANAVTSLPRSGKSAQSSRELYDFLPRTGVRSAKQAPVERAFTATTPLEQPDVIEYVAPPVPRPNAPRKPSKAEMAAKQLRFQRSLIAIALLLLIGSGAYAAFLYRSSDTIQKYAGPVIARETVAQAFPGQNGIDLMIIGRDYDYTNQDQIQKTNARSDMLMVAHIDFMGKVAHLLSIPRDTAAVIPGHGINKINAAHAYGGPSLTSATLTDNYGIKPTHYVALDFDGFQQAIDILGGVDCVVDKKMDYDDNWGHLHIHLLPGMQHLNGEQAMDFVRFRHSDSDVVRTHRQQALMAAIKVKLMQPQSLALLPKLLDTIDKHIDTDLTPAQTVALASFIHDLPDDSIQMLTMPTITKGQITRTDYANAEPIVSTWFNATIPVKVSKLVETHRHRSMHVVRVAANLAKTPLYD